MTTQSTTKMPSSGYGASIWRILKSIGLLRESWVGMIGAFLVLFWVLVAIFAPWIAHFDPNASIQPFASPGTLSSSGYTFWLGTDHMGRDILSRIGALHHRYCHHWCIRVKYCDCHYLCLVSWDHADCTRIGPRPSQPGLCGRCPDKR